MVVLISSFLLFSLCDPRIVLLICLLYVFLVAMLSFYVSFCTLMEVYVDVDYVEHDWV